MAKLTNRQRYAFMKQKLEKAINEDRDIIVTFVSKSRTLKSITKSQKEIYKVNRRVRSITLNPQFLSMCRKQAIQQKKKDYPDVILSHLFDMRHDFNEHHFLINATR